MKRTRLYIWILLGGIAVCFMLVIFNLSSPVTGSKNKTTGAAAEDPVQWDWPSSLDAMIAAPGFHKLIFEDDQIRILEVTVNPGETEPIHTYKGKSLVWIVKSSPVIYTVYGKDQGSKLIPLKKDTIIMKPDELNKANWEKPQPPHSIQNIGTDTFRLYRIEYKK